MSIRISAISDRGIERQNNEDAVLVCTDLINGAYEENKISVEKPLHEKGSLIIVADGMGGASAGEVASAIAVKTILSALRSSIEGKLDNEDLIHALLKDVVKHADEAINAHVADNPDTIGMGTTVVIQWILGDKVYIAWCGDSRCYCYNNASGLKRLTKDHSYVQELLDSHQITEDEAFAHPDNNMITRCLGDTDTVADADVITYRLREGDVLLSCSDGLCGFCKDEYIEAMIRESHSNLDTCRDKLFKAAMDAGGSDNITISLCKVDGVAQKTGVMNFLKSLFS